MSRSQWNAQAQDNRVATRSNNLGATFVSQEASSVPWRPFCQPFSCEV
jgi:hypothetical protein